MASRPGGRAAQQGWAAEAARMKSWLFLDGMARSTTDETTPALVARGVFAMNLVAGRIHIGGSPCPT
jgi:hypothetical protein